MYKAKVTLGPVDYGMTAEVRNHKVIIDEPVNNGGGNTGPSPQEYLCVALASCTTATIKMYTNHKHWKIDSIIVEVEKDTLPDGKNIFKRTLHIKGPFDDKQMDRILQIANSCPVHKILSQANTIETVFGS
ncbi:MAG TPA: OsmC family protein [Bacteroidia bacterium]|jgi:putative redox protein|nr:OsmC family protein [Bacteroidia bacterium]